MRFARFFISGVNKYVKAADSVCRFIFAQGRERAKQASENSASGSPLRAQPSARSSEIFYPALGAYDRTQGEYPCNSAYCSCPAQQSKHQKPSVHTSLEATFAKLCFRNGTERLMNQGFFSSLCLYCKAAGPELPALKARQKPLSSVIRIEAPQFTGKVINLCAYCLTAD